MANSNINVLAAGNQIPVSTTLAQILQALTLGASVTLTFPPASDSSVVANAGSPVTVSNTSGTTAGTGAATLSAAPVPNAAAIPAAHVPSAGPVPNAAAPVPSIGHVPNAAAPIPNTGPILNAATPIPNVGPVPSIAAPITNTAAPIPNAAAPVPNVAAPVPNAAAPVPSAAPVPNTGPVLNAAAPIPNAAAPAQQPPVPMHPGALAVGAQGGAILDITGSQYYVVTVGLQIGVFLGWSGASLQVNGVTGCTFLMIEKGYGARNRAMRQFNEAFANSHCCIVV
ncbi:hypothetical protein DXG01_015944 [Tephrocybe rancida]|nr:hypothetical protein DXG01_015944 [Tephrocybe rancida]